MIIQDGRHIFGKIHKVCKGTVQLRGMGTSKRVPNLFRTHDERVRIKVWTRSRTSSVNAFTAFTFAERICFCLAFLCFGVFYCSRETKRRFGFTMLSGNRDIGRTRKNWLLCWFRSSKESEKSVWCGLFLLTVLFGCWLAEETWKEIAQKKMKLTKK